MATATIYAPDGSLATKPSEGFSDEELKLLVAYKRFLAGRGYREALYCSRCFEGNMADGCNAHVKTSQGSVEALIECRCRAVYGKGGGLI